MTRATWRRRPRRTWPPPASPTPRTSAPRPSSTSSTACASRPRANESFYHIDSEAGAWNTGALEDNRGYKVRYKGGYFPVPPVDHFADLRAEISLELDASGLQVERQHHEVGTAGQAEINYKFNTLLAAADDLMLFKYIVKNVAWRNGKTATFMPKPIFGDNGSGMHVHQSLWQGGDPLFYDEQGYAGLSDTARYYIGGILKHAPSLLAFTNPTVNSYHRLVPGFEAPVNLVYSQRNRSAAMRIPITGLQPEGQARRVPRPGPVRATRTWPSRRCCWRAWTASRTRSSRPSRSTRTSTSWPPRSTRASRRSRPRSRPSSTALEADHEYLLRPAASSPPDLIETWIDYKRTNEIAPIQLRPHPHEFELYFDV